MVTQLKGEKSSREFRRPCKRGVHRGYIGGRICVPCGRLWKYNSLPSAYTLFISCSTVKGSDPRSHSRPERCLNQDRLAARRQRHLYRNTLPFSYISQYVANTYAARMQSSVRGHRMFRKHMPRDPYSWWSIFLRVKLVASISLTKRKKSINLMSSFGSHKLYDIIISDAQ